jgi:hypothetical protein
MSIVKGWLIGLASTGVMAVTGGSAAAIDLTGTWEGTAKCAVQEQGEPVGRGTFPAVLEISQSGTALNVSLSGLPASGLATDNGSDVTRGFMAFEACSSPPFIPFGGSGKATIGANAGKITGQFHLIGVEAVEICRLTVKRTSPADPGVPPCP